ncbi:DNA topoisomerase VI subunit B [Anaeromyxobacter paludicola]|uniref:Type 2 DNA topoisomerase 6 subunit B n=1 Tax=Anaeromyxobacter paludicola TaxID=2918171 RepID=A0ABM7XG10_9BACT|nr:DNA topoisomerase VI subunit B [Anaeromyxobacter paludicola]
MGVKRSKAERVAGRGDDVLPGQLELVPGGGGTRKRASEKVVVPVARSPRNAAAEVVEEPAVEAAPAPAPRQKRRATAEQMASKQREISISEFFTKNRHLLGFDNPSKALLTTIKEAVDNSLDACEEAGILPEITIEVHDLGFEQAGKADSELTKGEGRFRVVIEDNGPGIVKEQAPKIFGKLLYGSKFHRLKQSRGQQGIGISAAAMYGQLTTGQPIAVTSRTGKGKPTHYFEIQIDTRKNNPVVTRDDKLAEWHQEHGTRVELEIVANWQQGQRFVNRYVEHTALANPHATVHYVRPKQQRLSFPRATDELPKEAAEIKPHPHGVELGSLMLMAAESKSHDVKGFLTSAFSRVSPMVADEILKRTGWKKKVRPRDLAEDRDLAEGLQKAIQATKIMAPPTNCLSPIGDALMKKGLVSFLSVIETEGPEEDQQLDLDQAAKKKASKKEKQARAEAPLVPDAPPEEGVEKIKGHNYFIATVTRPPKVYRGNPFQVEVGLAYGGSWPADKSIELFRFANRVPLLFQRGACGVTEAVVKTDWRNYLLSQPKNSLPVGPMALLVHIASVWVPFTSESKEAVAHYPEIIREIQLAAQECGRKLAAHIRKRQHADYEAKRRSLFELYIEEVAQALGKITGKSPLPIKRDLVKVAREVTATELEEQDRELEEASEKTSRRPRRRSDEEAE